MDLFKEFPPVNSNQWKEQIVKDLKGIDFKTLVWDAGLGFDIQPFYTAEDLTQPVAPLFSHNHWDICEQITVTSEKEANERALKALEGGASGLAFYIHKKINTAVLIKNISLEHIYSQFFISNDALHVLDDLKDHYGKVNAFDGRVKCFVNIDPLSMAAFYGEWHESSDKDLSVLEKLSHIPVNLSLYQEAGANPVNELAVGLSHLNEYFHFLSERKQLAGKTIHFIVSVDSNFFIEIAKLRALRKLAALLQKQYSVNFSIHIHAQSCLLNKSGLDAYNNMLRTTVEGMAAVAGGCNSLCILPFNEGFEKSSDFSARIARNQQLILKEESYLDKVADAGAGSYYIEELTTQLASKAWERFKEIEKAGGFIACLTSNYLQNIIAKDATKLLEDVSSGKLVLLGVNKFPNPKDKPLPSSSPKEKTTSSTFQPVKPLRLSESFERKTEHA